MNIRQKNGAVRIAIKDTKNPCDVDYLLLEPAKCWSSTFNAWGKATDASVVSIGAKTYRVVLEEIHS